MNGNCHFVFGAALGVSIAVNADKIETILPNITYSPTTTTLFVLGGLLGGIFPDIDNPSSYMGKLTVPLSSAIGEMSKVFGKTGANHRGILHDPTIYLLGLLFSYLYFPSLAGIFIGCLSHLFLDMFNPSGIPFMFRGRLRAGKIKSGSKESIIFTWVSVLLVLIAGITLKLGFNL